MFHGYIPAHNAGAELTVHAMLRHLASLGAEVDVQLSRTHPDVKRPYETEGVRVWPFVDTGDAVRWMENSRPDVLIAHLENQPRACALGDLYGVPVVHVLHNTHDFSKHALRRGPSHLAVFNTNWMRQDYAAWFSAAGQQLPPNVTIHPPVYARDYAVAEPGKHITLINLWEGKGGPLFWELARRLPNRKFMGVRGAYGEQVIDDLPNVHVTGHKEPAQMRYVYNETRILLMPSEYESYGRTALEAACSGIPTVAHPTPGLREALGPDGIFVDRDDTDGWVAALSRLGTPKAWALESRKARARADQLTPDADLDRFADAVEGVAARGLTRTAG